MNTIAIQVDEDLAQAFQEYELDQQQEIQKLINDWLREAMNIRNLKQSMAQLSAEAKANGLTPEILQEILDEEI